MFKDLKVLLSQARSALRRRGATQHDAEDLTQEAWIRLDAYRKSNAVLNPDALLMRTALNLSINEHWRRARQGVGVPVDDAALVDSSPAADALLLSRERLRRLEAGLALLTDRSRQLFLEHHLEGKTQLQLAREQGISVTAVQRHLAKATLTLAGWMEGW
jgi:RNA polymerase sigma-70 factor (ECF subfamily)